MIHSFGDALRLACFVAALGIYGYLLFLFRFRRPPTPQTASRSLVGTLYIMLLLAAAFIYTIIEGIAGR